LLDEEPALDELPTGVELELPTGTELELLPGNAELELPGNHFSSHSFSLGNSKDELSAQDKKKITANPNIILFLIEKWKYTKK
jgi:hypothetical protein